MSNIVNLRQARKQAARRRARADADANAARHGVSGPDKEKRRLEQQREARHLDGHRREHGAPENDDQGTPVSPT